MPQATDSSPSSPPSSRGILNPGLALVFAGALLWAAGISVARLHYGDAGIALRWAGFTLLAVATLRRSSLLRWTFLAMLCGVELGIDAPHAAMQTRVLSDLFLRLIRLIVAPLLFAIITTGIAAHSELRSVGRLAVKSLVYFEVVTTLGLIIGAVVMNLSGIGWSVMLPAGADVALPSVAVHAAGTWQQTVLNLVPENIAEAVAQNQVLQVAVASVLFGIALALLPRAKTAPLLSVLESVAAVMFKVTTLVIYLAPLAAGAALAYTVGSIGWAALLPLGRFVLACYGGLAAFAMLVLLPSLLICRIGIRRFVAAIGEPVAIGFATTTSEAALPLAMERMEEFGVPRWIVSFVVPTGYSFNLSGSSVYLAMAAIFMAQVSRIHLGLVQQISMLAILMLASKGVAGIPRAVLVVLMATASSIHLPAEPIVLLLGIDAVMDMGRTAVNVAGNCVASAVIASSEGALIRGDRKTTQPVP